MENEDRLGGVLVILEFQLLLGSWLEQVDISDGQAIDV